MPPNWLVIHKRSDLIIGAFQHTSGESIKRKFNSVAYHVIGVCDVIYGMHRKLRARHKSETLVNTKELMKTSPAFHKAMKDIQARRRSKLPWV
ncbi:hypothetical protein GCM10011247_41160 [Pseudomonas plecoglossicida]|nr:hypothetical protein GCM10011247_41160 [Pseudomonas plecoglossicida]